MLHLSLHPRSDRKEPDQAVDILLARMRQRLYPETLPVLASCWLKTLSAGGHNRPWWLRLKRSLEQALLDAQVEPFAADVLRSTLVWTQHALASGGDLPSAPSHLQPPFRAVEADRLVAYTCRLLNEWLPAELATLLTDEDEVVERSGEGIPVLAIARALHAILVRERLSPETLEALLAPEGLSPHLVYPADVEILRDVVLSILGRLSAPPLPLLPAILLGISDTGLPDAIFDAGDGHEEIHLPITEAEALRILRHDPFRISSVIVTMDGRAWQPWTLTRGDRNLIVFRPGDRLRIDTSADHARLILPWPDRPASWSGDLPMHGPFALFGREWRVSSWEMEGDSTLLHLTFSRVLAIQEPPAGESARHHLRAASVDMAWSELERALAESLDRGDLFPIEQMRREEMIPLGRALYALAESLQPGWQMPDANQLETQLRAVRYYQASIAEDYGSAPWRILPASLQSALARRHLAPASHELLADIFGDAQAA